MKQAALPTNDRSERRWPWILIALGAMIILFSALLWLYDRPVSEPALKADSASTTSSTNSDPSNDYITLALTRAGAGDAAGALEALDIAIATGPDNAAEAYYYRGLIKVEQGDLDDALEDFTLGIAGNQHMPELFAARGTTYATLGRPATALEDFNTAVQLAPDHAATYVNRGQAYFNMGEPDLALEDFNKALELDEGLVAAYFNRGVLQLEKSDAQAAMDDFNACIEISPEAPAPYFNRAVAYMELNNLEAAAADLVVYIGMAEDEIGRHQAEALLASLTEYEENSHLGDE